MPAEPPPEAGTTTGSLLSSARAASLGTLVSRMLGLVRDVLTAATIGAGLFWDAFVIAFQVPNLFRRLFGEGALSSAFVAVHSEHLARGDRAAAERTANLVGTGLVLLLAGVVAAGLVALLALPVDRLAAGESREKLALIVSLSAVMFPYLLLVCFTAFLMAVLNSFGRFGVAALTPAPLNVLWIGVLVAGMVLGWPERTLVFTLAGAVLVAGVAQVAMLVPSLRAAGVRIRPDFRLRDPELRQVFALMLPVVLGLAPTQLNVLVDQYIAEAFIPGHGANAVLYYGNRLMQFPLAIIGIAMGTAAFPLLARLAALDRRNAMAGVTNLSLRVSFFVAVPAAVGLFAVAEPLVRLLFERGAFGAEATRETARVLGAFAVGVPGFCALQIVTRAHYALRDTATPVRVGLAAVLLNLGLNFALVGPLGAAGLALSTSVAAIANFSALAFLLRRKVGRIGGRLLARSVARTAAVALLMGAVCGLLAAGAGALLGTATLAARLASVFVPVAAGVAFFALAARFLRLPEAKDILESFSGRKRRGAGD